MSAFAAAINESVARIRKYYYIFMTAIVGFVQFTQKGFPLNDFRTYPSP